MYEDYINTMQLMISKWKKHFRILDNWNIQFILDEGKWSMIEYSIPSKMAKIYACDILDEESYILNQVIKIAFIAVENMMEEKLLLIEDLTTIIMEK